MTKPVLLALVAAAVAAGAALGRMSGDSEAQAASLQRALERNTGVLQQMSSRLAAVESRPVCEVASAPLDGTVAGRGEAVPSGTEAPVLAPAAALETPPAPPTPAEMEAFDAADALLERGRSSKSWSSADGMELHRLTAQLRPADRDDVLRRVSVAITRGELRADALAMSP